MINISRSVIDLAQAAVPLPAKLDDVAVVKAYLDGLTLPISKLIVEVAQAIKAGKLGVIGEASPEEIREAVAEELEARGLTMLDPAVLEAIVTLVMFLIKLLGR